MNERTNRIWQPVVHPTDNHLPRPGSLDRHQPQQLYTKTSLVTEQGSRDFNLRSLNREILSASQSYNNTPKPFTRQTTQSPTSQIVGSTRPCLSSLKKDGSQQVKFNQKKAQETSESEQSTINNQQQQETQEENMVPKLVHNPYNSPLDLYSMNNIRKTIEAHTELIAPGLKGINFMKPDTPVNKQSEVYKLVMEEERQRSRQVPSRLSPISGQSLDAPNTFVGRPQCSQKDDRSAQSISAERYHNIEQQQKDHQERQISQQAAQKGTGAPSCSECGQFIVGPFAKIQNRFVHPKCFNCTTCGTSLKNSGYYTINEKLYCDIHAKQVANMMHIQYNFASKFRQQNQLNPDTQTEQTQLQQSNFRLQGTEILQQPVSSTISELCQRNLSKSTSPATISTMFADRSNSETINERRETKWTWRPVANKGRSSGALSPSTMIASSSYQQQDTSSKQSLAPSSQASQQQQSLVSTGTRGRGLLQESSLTDDRMPVCVHCRVKIHGPYILAGEATWCKLCSQTNFNCTSCHRSLLDIGFIKDSLRKYYCEHCFEAYYAPVCSKCNIRIKGDCLNALTKQWHPSCFVCGHCRRPFGNSSFYLEDNVPYCERDWNILFTTKCYSCSYPIEAGDKWIEAIDRNYHSNCFRCTSCQANLEGSTFYCKNGKPYCRLHAR